MPCSQDETPTAAAAQDGFSHIHEDFKGKALYSHRSSWRLTTISRARQLQQQQGRGAMAMQEPDWLSSTGVPSTRDCWAWGPLLLLHTVRQHTTTVHSSSSFNNKIKLNQKSRRAILIPCPLFGCSVNKHQLFSLKMVQNKITFQKKNCCDGCLLPPRISSFLRVIAN